MSKYFPKPYEAFGRDINVKVDLSNYATKADIKNSTHIDTSGFALKTNLANLKTGVDKLDINKLKNSPNNLSNLKTKVDKLDIDKLVTAPVDLSKLSNVVKNEVAKKTEYNAKHGGTDCYKKCAATTRSCCHTSVLASAKIFK